MATIPKELQALFDAKPGLQAYYEDNLNAAGNFVWSDRTRFNPHPEKTDCMWCGRLREGNPIRCDAFGDQPIPADIWDGRRLHFEPVAGDHGLTFLEIQSPGRPRQG